MRAILACLSVLLVAAAPSAGFKLKHHGKIYSYEYSWPKEAVAIPALNRKLTQAMARNRREIAEEATSAFEDSRSYDTHFPEVGYETSLNWQTVGVTQKLLSLAGGSYSFTGGAHGNPAAVALLWDRTLNREIGVNALFASAARFAAVTRAPYCKKLDGERAKRREGERLDPLSDFNNCPKYSELAIYPADKNRNGRFERILFVASPYVAGPFAEGDYEIAVPVTPGLIAALKPEYRSSFEVQRQ
jgi:hypothetical protein